jgi:hypothetical protein
MRVAGEVASIFRTRVQVDFGPSTDLTGGMKPMKKPRRDHSPAFKARVAVEAIRGD